MRKRPTEPSGLYDPAFEHDACGVTFVARLNGVPTHETLVRGLTAVANLEHRGAAGADAQTGDGAGILLQMPDRFIRAVVGDQLPPSGQYGVGVCFFPQGEARRLELEQLLVDTVEAEGQRVLAWRDVPVDDGHVGVSANVHAPRMRQLVVGASPALASD
jgi:glutamate synthase domain-containing protein 1